MDSSEDPHLRIKAALKLNPNFQLWRWQPHRSCWKYIDCPKWHPDGIYAVSNSWEEKPSWTPTVMARIN